MIYQLNGRVHFELTPDVMAALVKQTTLEGVVPDSPLGIGLVNFRSALQNELDRVTPASPPPQESAWD